MGQFYFILCAFVFPISFFGQISSAKITYEARLNNDDHIKNILEDSLTSPEIKTLQLEDAKNKSPVRFHLLVNKNEALFKSEVGMENKEKMRDFNMTSAMAQEQITYYSNQKTKEQFYQSYFRNDVLVEFKEPRWKITNESKIIDGYRCLKAFANVDFEKKLGVDHIGQIIAWYTPEIPISFGVKKYNGLPGLTLELIISYERGIVSFRVSQIELNSYSEIKIPEANTIITEKEFILSRIRD